MRRITCAVLALALLNAAPAAASPVLVLDGKRVTVHDDPALPATAELPPPAAVATGSRRRAAISGSSGAAFGGGMRALYEAGAIDAATYRKDKALYRDARDTGYRLGGTRGSELLAVVANVNGIAARGALTASRLHPLLLTLQANLEWWTNGRLLGAGERVQLAHSPLVYQYYPGQGIELQMLGNWGKANYYAETHQDRKLRRDVAYMLTLGVRRAGGIAWEYYFDFDGGAPPWVSGLAQGTAIQALAHATQRLVDPSYLDIAHSALKLFTAAPPQGVRVHRRAGPHYLIYSFLPHYYVANAFAQALTGLYDLGTIAPDATAMELFHAGDHEFRRELPRYDTGAWSLYEGVNESTLSYHVLLRDFLRNLCSRVKAGVYCTTAGHFTRYLHTPPRITLLSRRLRHGRAGEIAFRVSKVSSVGVTVTRGGSTALATSASVTRGVHRFGWSPGAPGLYAVHFRAVDLAGNVRHVTRRVRVL